jgi:hypothetical protein
MVGVKRLVLLPGRGSCSAISTMTTDETCHGRGEAATVLASEV